jgi:hypothetical protein
MVGSRSFQFSQYVTTGLQEKFTDGNRSTCCWLKLLFLAKISFDIGAGVMPGGKDQSQPFTTWSEAIHGTWFMSPIGILL